LQVAVISPDLELVCSGPEIRAKWKIVHENIDEYWALYELGKKLVDLEDYFRRWRFNHVNTVERVIGFAAPAAPPACSICAGCRVSSCFPSCGTCAENSDSYPRRFPETRSSAVIPRAIRIQQYQATSMAYRANRRATHVLNNTLRESQTLR